MAIKSIGGQGLRAFEAGRTPSRKTLPSWTRPLDLSPLHAGHVWWNTRRALNLHELSRFLLNASQLEVYQTPVPHACRRRPERQTRACSPSTSDQSACKVPIIDPVLAAPPPLPPPPLPPAQAAARRPQPTLRAGLSGAAHQPCFTPLLRRTLPCGPWHGRCRWPGRRLPGPAGRGAACACRLAWRGERRPSIFLPAASRPRAGPCPSACRRVAVECTIALARLRSHHTTLALLAPTAPCSILPRLKHPQGLHPAAQEAWESIHAIYGLQVLWGLR